MSTTIRDIITEGLSRSNVVSRRQTPPEPMMQTAFRLLNGIAAKFSNDNLLQFLRRSVEFTPTSEEVKIGESTASVTVDVSAEDIQDVKACYCDGVELAFVSFEDMPNGNYGSHVYSWQPITDSYGKIYFKPELVRSGRPVKAIYNVKWDFDINSTLYVPEKYVELFNLALAHKLAVNFPRLSSEQVNIMKSELEEMIQNVRTTTSAEKYITRSNGRDAMSYNDFISGAFL